MQLLKKIFMKKDAALVVALLILFTKLLGFVKIRIIAGQFGAGQELDLFWAAFLIPDTLFNILVAGSINAAIIPVFSDVLYQRGERSLVKLMSTTMFFVAIAVVIIVLILFASAESMSGFLINTQFVSRQYNLSTNLGAPEIETLTRLIRIMLLSPLLLGLSSIITAFLQVHKKFFITTLAPLVYNLGIIIGTVIFVDDLSVFGLAWAVVLGSLLHFLVQIPITISFVRDHLYIKSINRIQGEMKFYYGEVYQMVKLAIPRVIAFAGEQFAVVFNTIVAFSLTEGALSAYRFAISLYTLPVHVIAGSISTIALPNFSESYSKGQESTLVNLYNSAIRKTLFLIFPCVAILLILRLPIVRLAFGTGNFDWWDTVVTSWVLALLGFAVIGQSVVIITLRALYAIHETRLPLLATVATIVVNIVGTYYFTNFFSHYSDWRPILQQIVIQLSSGVSEGGAGGAFDTMLTFVHDLKSWFTTRNVFDAAVGGLAMSLSLAFLTEMTLNMFFLNRRIHFMNRTQFTMPLIKMALASILMTVIMYIVFRFSDFSLDTTRTFGVFIVVVVTSLVGGFVYFSSSLLLGVKEAQSTLRYTGVLFERVKRVGGKYIG